MTIKILSLLLLLGTSFPMFAHAQADVKHLKDVYGPRLYSVSIDAKYAFLRVSGKKWSNSSMAERQLFLTTWDAAKEKEAKEQEAMKVSIEKEKEVKDKARQEKDKAFEKKKRDIEKQIEAERKAATDQKNQAERKADEMTRQLDQMHSHDHNTGR